MKKQSKLTKLFTFIALLCALSSCVDDDPAFAILEMRAYIYQQNSPAGAKFLPVIRVVMNQTASNVICEGGSVGFVTMEPEEGTSGTVWRTRFTESQMTRESPGGDYTLEVFEEDGQSIERTVTVPSAAPLGYIQVTEPPVCENGGVSVKWAPVANAGSYGVYILEPGEELYPLYFEVIPASEYSVDGMTVAIDAEIMERFGLRKGAQYDVCVVASGAGIISYSEKTRITL